MSNVKALPGVVARNFEPKADLIAALEDILEDAKSGKLQSFFASGFTADGLRMSYICQHHNVYEVVGSMEFLKTQYISEWTEKL